MHNCKSTRSSFIDLALDEIPPAGARQLLAELNDCPACRAEYAGLRSTLHVSGQALRSALPGEEFWSDYHARLRSRLLDASAAESEGGGEPHSSHAPPARTTPGSVLWLSLRRIATTSVRVPVPAGLALLLLFGLSMFLLRPLGRVNPTPATGSPGAETITVQVPVIQEKVVTRVVYVLKRSRQARRSPSRETSTFANSVAHARLEAGTGLNLAGFKPTSQVKFTIIKGTYQNEK